MFGQKAIHQIDVSSEYLKYLPVFNPPLKTQAPGVLATFRRPVEKSFFNRGEMSNDLAPPVTEMSSFGGFSPQWLVIKLNICSGFVSSAENRMNFEFDLSEDSWKLISP